MGSCPNTKTDKLAKVIILLNDGKILGNVMSYRKSKLIIKIKVLNILVVKDKKKKFIADHRKIKLLVMRGGLNTVLIKIFYVDALETERSNIISC